MPAPSCNPTCQPCCCSPPRAPRQQTSVLDQPRPRDRPHQPRRYEEGGGGGGPGRVGAFIHSFIHSFLVMFLGARPLKGISSSWSCCHCERRRRASCSLLTPAGALGPGRHLADKQWTRRPVTSCCRRGDQPAPPSRQWNRGDDRPPCSAPNAARHASAGVRFSFSSRARTHTLTPVMYIIIQGSRPLPTLIHPRALCVSSSRRRSLPQSGTR